MGLLWCHTCGQLVLAVDFIQRCPECDDSTTGLWDVSLVPEAWEAIARGEWVWWG